MFEKFGKLHYPFEQWTNYKTPHKSTIPKIGQDETKVVSFGPTQCCHVPRLKNENVPIEPHLVVQPQELNPDHNNSRRSGKVRNQPENGSKTI